MSDAPEKFRYELSEAVREIAISLPETTEGSSCVNRAFKAGGKNFAFLGEKDDECGLRLKLSDSIPAIAALEAADPKRYSVGKGGWAMLRMAPADPPALDDLEAWIIESFRLLAPKKIVAQLDA